MENKHKKNENINIPVSQTLIIQLLNTVQTNKYIYNHLHNKEIVPEKLSERQWNEMFVNN